MEILFSVPNLPLFANSAFHLLLRARGDAFEHNSNRSDNPHLMLPPTDLLGEKQQSSMGRLTCSLKSQQMESICIPIFQQKEALRDIKRLCETIALYEGCIFAPLKLPDKSGSNGCFIHVLHNDLNGPSHHSDALPLPKGKCKHSENICLQLLAKSVNSLTFATSKRDTMSYGVIGNTQDSGS